MKTINTQFQQNIVEDLNKNYLSETKESYKIKTLEILENPNTTFSEFGNEMQVATDLSRLLKRKPGAMLNEQLTMLGLHNQASKTTTNESVNNSSFTGAPNLEPKVLGGVA